MTLRRPPPPSSQLRAIHRSATILAFKPKPQPKRISRDDELRMIEAAVAAGKMTRCPVGYAVESEHACIVVPPTAEPKRRRRTKTEAAVIAALERGTSIHRIVEMLHLRGVAQVRDIMRKFGIKRSA